jgi:hypothetical protein
VKQLTEAMAEMPHGSCPDLLILPLYASMPLELQVLTLCLSPWQKGTVALLVMPCCLADTSMKDVPGWPDNDLWLVCRPGCLHCHLRAAAV